MAVSKNAAQGTLELTGNNCYKVILDRLPVLINDFEINTARAKENALMARSYADSWRQAADEYQNGLDACLRVRDIVRRFIAGDHKVKEIRQQQYEATLHHLVFAHAR